MYDKTRKDLEAMIELLENDGSRWSLFFQKAMVAFEQGEYQHCGEIILSGSGGMGSLNDLVLGQTKGEDGKFQWKKGYEEINNSYQELLSSLYVFAQGMRHAANKRVN
ncbi:DUF6966 domain-containing protein [Thalassomonas haliotis]|uniref:DUF6966 domain-containing protein n=1 Tax=Thalassomonas haliotis TaxID=485448 RepID=A0ABY7VD77_9GAMM|nr:hypothetical protein [Thalassomonas haliotis]WDE10868.1 hypothetical protein H3N35_21875 [Thalassomonas haliotis]